MRTAESLTETVRRRLQPSLLDDRAPRVEPAQVTVPAASQAAKRASAAPRSMPNVILGASITVVVVWIALIAGVVVAHAVIVVASVMAGLP